MTPNDESLELLSAYLDSALSEAERRTLEARLRIEPALQSTLDQLRATRAMLRAAPELTPPRDFRLTRAQARRPIRTNRMLYAFGALAASLIFIVGALYLSQGLEGPRVASAPSRIGGIVALQPSPTSVAPGAFPTLNQPAETTFAAYNTAQDTPVMKSQVTEPPTLLLLPTPTPLLSPTSLPAGTMAAQSRLPETQPAPAMQATTKKATDNNIEGATDTFRASASPMPSPSPLPTLSLPTLAPIMATMPPPATYIPANSPAPFSGADSSGGGINDGMPPAGSSVIPSTPTERRVVIVPTMTPQPTPLAAQLVTNEMDKATMMSIFLLLITLLLRVLGLF